MSGLGYETISFDLEASVHILPVTNQPPQQERPSTIKPQQKRTQKQSVADMLANSYSWSTASPQPSLSPTKDNSCSSVSEREPLPEGTRPRRNTQITPIEGKSNLIREISLDDDDDERQSGTLTEQNGNGEALTGHSAVPKVQASVSKAGIIQRAEINRDQRKKPTPVFTKSSMLPKHTTGSFKGKLTQRKTVPNILPNLAPSNKKSTTRFPTLHETSNMIPRCLKDNLLLVSCKNNVIQLETNQETFKLAMEILQNAFNDPGNPAYDPDNMDMSLSDTLSISSEDERTKPAAQIIRAGIMPREESAATVKKPKKNALSMSIEIGTLTKGSTSLKKSASMKNISRKTGAFAPLTRKNSDPSLVIAEVNPQNQPTIHVTVRADEITSLRSLIFGIPKHIIDIPQVLSDIQVEYMKEFGVQLVFRRLYIDSDSRNRRFGAREEKLEKGRAMITKHSLILDENDLKTPIYSLDCPRSLTKIAEFIRSSAWLHLQNTALANEKQHIYTASISSDF